jgi:hypothetical protein
MASEHIWLQSGGVESGYEGGREEAAGGKKTITTILYVSLVKEKRAK